MTACRGRLDRLSRAESSADNGARAKRARADAGRRDRSDGLGTPRARREPAGEPTLLSNRYQLHERIGEGGFAITYRAWDAVLGRDVAVKMLRPQFAADPALVARFAAEARAAASVAHPNIVEVYDYGTHAGTFFIVLQYVPGRDLKRVLTQRGRLPPAEAVWVAHQLLQGLAAIHAAGIVHRDIKPQNVLVGDDGAVRLTDFGIARGPAGTALTSTGTTLGTADYMAPEQARGSEVGVAADMYAVGVVLFELLTGRLPFVADTPLAVMLAHVEEPPPSPRAVAPDAGIPSTLDAVVLRALAKKPGARYASAADMDRALTAAAGAGRPLMAGARPAPTEAPTAPFPTRPTRQTTPTRPIRAARSTAPPTVSPRPTAPATRSDRPRIWAVALVIAALVVLGAGAWLGGARGWLGAGGGHDATVPPRRTVAAVAPGETPTPAAPGIVPVSTAPSAPPTPAPTLAPEPTAPPTPTATATAVPSPTPFPTTTAVPTTTVTPVRVVPNATEPPIQPIQGRASGQSPSGAADASAQGVVGAPEMMVAEATPTPRRGQTAVVSAPTIQPVGGAPVGPAGHDAQDQPGAGR